ncbi:MAG: hypothetical protein ACREDT_09850 [Methylocella sp.]
MAADRAQVAAEQGESKPLARRALSGAVAAIASIGADADARREVLTLGIGHQRPRLLSLSKGRMDHHAPTPARGFLDRLSIKTAGLALRESCGECRTAARRRALARRTLHRVTPSPTFSGHIPKSPR